MIWLAFIIGVIAGVLLATAALSVWIIAAARKVEGTQ